MRATCEHDFKNFVLNDLKLRDKFKVEASPDTPNWTENFLSAFAKPDAEYFVDHDYPGWLAWPKEFSAYVVDAKEDPARYDELETRARKKIGSLMTRSWFHEFFAHLKQEPREGSPDRFRMASSMLLQFTFDLIRAGVTAASLDDVKEELNEVFGDGSDKHQHRATAEILAAYICSYSDASVADRNSMWADVFPMLQKIFEEGLTPENSSYWSSFVHIVLVSTHGRMLEYC